MVERMVPIDDFITSNSGRLASLDVMTPQLPALAGTLEECFPLDS